MPRVALAVVTKWCQYHCRMHLRLEGRIAGGTRDQPAPRPGLPQLRGTETARLRGACPRGLPGCPEIHDGYLWPNDRPGLGIDIGEGLAAQYPFPEDPLGGSCPPVRRLDGTVARP